MNGLRCSGTHSTDLDCKMKNRFLETAARHRIPERFSPRDQRRRRPAIGAPEIHGHWNCLAWNNSNVSCDPLVPLPAVARVEGAEALGVASRDEHAGPAGRRQHPLGARPSSLATGSFATIVRSGRPGELEEVLSSPDHRPLGAHFSRPRSRTGGSLVPASSVRTRSTFCFLRRCRLRHPARFSLRRMALSARRRSCAWHRLGASPVRLPHRLRCRGVERGQVRLAAVAGVGQGLHRLAAEILLDAIDQRDQLILIVNVRREPMLDDDLRFGRRPRPAHCSPG